MGDITFSTFCLVLLSLLAICRAVQYRLAYHRACDELERVTEELERQREQTAAHERMAVMVISQYREEIRTNSRIARLNRWPLEAHTN